MKGYIFKAEVLNMGLPEFGVMASKRVYVPFEF